MISNLEWKEFSENYLKKQNEIYAFDIGNFETFIQ